MRGCFCAHRLAVGIARTLDVGQRLANAAVEGARKGIVPDELGNVGRIVTSATLRIAKFDRLSRKAAFLLTLRDSGARFVAADMPEANDLTVGIMALVAEQEREAISRRTREALAAARPQGVRYASSIAPASSVPLVRARRPSDGWR